MKKVFVMVLVAVLVFDAFELLNVIDFYVIILHSKN